MINFTLNGTGQTCDADSEKSLLEILRDVLGVTTVKDGCSGQGACGACLVELDGRPALACVTPISRVDGRAVRTLAGFPERVRTTLARAFVHEGAVQCGFCTPGMLTRAAILLTENPGADREAITRVLRPHLCRCTGYIKIIQAIEKAAEALAGAKEISLRENAAVGLSYTKVRAYGRALGESPFVDDLRFEAMIHGALRLSDHPRARVVGIDMGRALASDGVIRVVTAADIPGTRYHGLIFPDWPLLVAVGEITRYVGDVLAVVVAKTRSEARRGAALVDVEYEVLEPVTDPFAALKDKAPRIHETGNLLETCVIRRGEPIEETLTSSAYRYHGVFTTQRIEHAFLETEAAVALPTDGGGVHVYGQGQGVYDDRRQIAAILDLPEESVLVTLVPNGGAFGGKEDLSVQGHAALCAHLMGSPVNVRLSREESIRVHPKRHPMQMELEVGCDGHGKLTGVYARIVGDTGAYASVGTKVLERAAGHATGAYQVPNIDLQALTVYTNNIPCGAMRGFGVCQITFALESCVDELCRAGGFDRWQFRYDNALTEGCATSTGQILRGGVGVRETLLAVKAEYDRATYAGLACGLKNTGIGNGMNDEGDAKIEIRDAQHVVLHHGWTEMGQGVDTIAVQVLCEETGIDPAIVEVVVSTENEARGGMTTASRGSAILGNAIIDAARRLKDDLRDHVLADLVGRVYAGRWVCDWTTKPDTPGESVTHFAYGYATQLVILDEGGQIVEVVAAHDAGRVLNPSLFEGQIQGAVHMGLGYALSEELPMREGRLISDRLADCGLVRVDRMPRVVVKGVEVSDPVGPYGAKGVGEIGLVPTAAAVANALAYRDGKRRMNLPLSRPEETPWPST